MCSVCSGKMLGGSTSLNAMIYIRGAKQSFDDWEIKYKNPGWSYDHVLPYFKKSEGNLDQSLDPKYHGFSGPMMVSRSPYIKASEKLFIDAARELNISVNNDFNGATEIGIGRAHVMIGKGVRSEAFNAFISPAKDRPNLFILTYGTVTKVLINESKVADGVQISYKEQSEWTAFASKEVIVSAGAIGSPKLLLNSGIGPKQQLTKLNIPVKQNLPVGKHLLDHLNTFLFFKAENVNEDSNITDARKGIPQNVAPNSESSTSLSYLASVLNTNPNKHEPNYETLNFAFGKGTPNLYSTLKFLGFNESAMQPVLDINKNHDILGILFYFFTPESTGTVKLNSSNLNDQPFINTNYLATDDDINGIAEAMHQQTLFGNTAAFRAKSAELIHIPLAQCDHLKFPSKDYYKCSIHYLSESGLHQCCTNKMGPASDPTTVVDSELRVHGIPNLRVIDVSM